MKNKIAFYLAAAAVALGLYYYYTAHFLVNFESEKRHAEIVFNEEISAFRASLTDSDGQIFDSIYSEANARVLERKYFIRFLGIGSDYEVLAPQFFDCTREIISAVHVSNSNADRIENHKAQLTGRYGNDFDDLYNRLRSRRELVYKTSNIDVFRGTNTNTSQSGGVTRANSTQIDQSCTRFFPGLGFVLYKAEDWAAIEEHLARKRSIVSDVERANTTARNELQRAVNSSIRTFREPQRPAFRNRVAAEEASLLQKTNSEFTVDSGRFSPTVFSLETLTFNQSNFNRFLQREQNSHWSGNSLATGSRPYSNCFPATNGCSGFNCSEIRVNNTGSDVVVTVKNTSGRVVRHAYIRANDSFTFHLPDGRYQTFFYSGRGWNPHKDMDSSTCSQLRGGFVDGGSFTKDPGFDTLNRNIITYTLTPTRAGNFNTAGSSANQNF